jgi:hypothetical protein
MKIEYENKFSDILMFHAVHQLLSPVVQGFFLLIFLFIFWSELNFKGEFVSAAITAGIWYLAIWIVQFVFNVLYLYSRKNKSVLTKHTVEIQDEAFFEETKYNRSYFFWNGIVKVVRRPGFVAVYVTPHMAHIIPKRAFGSKARMLSFINECKNKLSAA